jgi:hypothetical protein
MAFWPRRLFSEAAQVGNIAPKIVPFFKDRNPANPTELGEFIRCILTDAGTNLLFAAPRLP